MCKSRIDNRRAADLLEEFISEASISKVPLTDHCITEITLNLTHRKRKSKGYWKFNLLKNKEYCSKIRQIIIAEIENDSTTNCCCCCCCNKWEYIEYKVRELSIKVSKEVNNERRRMQSVS